MAHNDKERKVLQLMKEVKVITSSVLGSLASRLAMCNKIHGMMTELGMPSFYIMINPADVYNLLVKFLAGDEIDIDNLLPKQVPKYWDQSILIARNPALAAQFFNIYMKAFVSSILGYDPKHQNLDGGTLGHVKGYYGCVEAQGHSTLHCHMMVWVEGGLNPNYESFWFTKLGLVCSPGLAVSKIFNNFLSLLIPLIDTGQTHCCRHYIT